MTKNTSIHARLTLLALALCTAAAPAPAQITFRAGSSATATGVTPAFRAAASATTTGSTLTITRPTGVVANDVMIAAIGVTPSSAVITPPAGWALVRRTDNAGPTANSLAVFYKVAVGGEPGTYAWGVSGASFAVGGIQAFSGVDTANPIDVENGQTTPSGTAHATPNVTTTVGNAMVVTAHTFASSRTWTPPSGMSESYDRPSGANSATGQSIAGSRVLQAVAGATGAKTATAAGNADVGNTHILALRPASANLNIATPSGTAANDVMIAAIGFNNASAAITPPAGWTLVRRVNNASTTSNSLAVYRRTAAAGEPASHTWAIAGGAFLVGGIQGFAGADAANPIDVEGGQTTASGTVHAAPSVTTTVPNAMLVTTHTFASSRTWTPQAGLTEAFDRPSGAASATGQSIAGNFQPQAAAGATGVKSATAAGNADVGNTHILVLRPVPANTPPTVSLTSPTNGAVFAAPANITLTATAADADGTIAQVEFFQGTTLLATVTSPPYTTSTNNLAAGAYSFTAKATDNQGAPTTSAPVAVTVNALPTVSLTSPTNGATFTAPATIPLTAAALDSDGTITKVEFFHGGTLLIATVTAAPYTFNWTEVAAASYSLTAKATDNQNGTTTSAPVNVTVNAAVAQLHFIHTDHLDTPRVITNQASQEVWRWDHAEPFGTYPANENPAGLGAFVFNLRLPGQYFDKETNLHYNYFRDYDSAIGRYIQSDPIGLAGGLNTYAYVSNNPLSLTDPLGLAESGPYHPPDGVSLRCTNADTCPQLQGKMQVLQRMISSHQGWDWNNPPPRGGGRHAIEIAELWRAYARCEAIFEQKCKNCPPEESAFSRWWRSLTAPQPKPAPDPAGELFGQTPRRQGPGAPGGTGFPAPTPRPIIP